MMMLFVGPSHRRILIIVSVFICLAICSIDRSPAQDKKLRAEELIARHAESLGSAESRAAVKSRVVSGPVKLVSRIGGVGSIEGEAMMVSSGPRLRFGMNFPSLDYPGEQMAFDGARAATGFLPNGVRSNLSQFLNQQDSPLKEGLLGGVLSTAWPLLRLEQQQPRLDWRGLKKIEGRELHELSYRPRKGSSDLKIALYFDPATFRHVHTQYSFEIGARLGLGPNESARQQESYYNLSEDFDDFRPVDGLMLPHRYRLQLSVQTATGSLLSDWTLNAARISHKETFSEQVFTLK